MNILAIGAHPDDVETMCAGTLAKYASQGHKVFIATATSGNIGSATHTMEEIAAIRKQEAANSAAMPCKLIISQIHLIYKHKFYFLSKIRKPYLYTQKNRLRFFIFFYFVRV